MWRETVGVVNPFRGVVRVLLLMTGLLGQTAGAVNIDMVTVGNPGNAADARYPDPPGTSGFGAVAYTYRIGKTEVTAGQYAEFLNAVAGVDTYGLYNPAMWSERYACKISRTGAGTEADPYVYGAAADAADRPVNFVSWGDAARFANWLTNGRPTGAQDLMTTEDGSYYLNGATSKAALMAVARKPSARYVIPTEDEWYKAAYYDPAKPGGAGYWDYPTRTNIPPGHDMSESTNPGNNANYGGGPIDPPYYTTVVGQFRYSHSAYGTFDQGGNVAEFNDAIYYGSDRTIRGGAFHAGYWYLGAWNRAYYSPTQASGDVGFRVAEVPEPCSLMLLGAAGSIAFVIRRK
jgi:sulfatase modifying factor 1